MREIPISVEIESCGDLKKILLLSKEIEELLFSLLKIDRRTLRKDEEKSRFKGKLQLYCTLYRKCREKFLKVKKDLKETSSYYKTPLTLEDLLKDFDIKRTLNSAHPVKKIDESILILTDDDEEDDEDIKEINTLEKQVIEINYLQELEKILNNMKNMINRNDPETVSNALQLSLVEFLEKYKEYTTTDKILSNIYHELRKAQSGKSNTQVIKDRVGIDSTTEPLDVLIPTTGSEIEQFILELGTRVRFKYHDGMERMGEVITFKDENSIVVKGDGNNIKYPIKRSMIVNVEVKKVVDIVEKESVSLLEQNNNSEETQEVIETPKEFKEIVEQQVSERSSKPFKEFSKDEKLSIIQSLYDSGVKKCGDVVTKMKGEGYIINHYDDVYNFFTKIKK